MLRVRDLSVTLGRRSIVDGISFDVRGGEAVALVGSNGAGKTTVFRAVLGLVRYGGAITVDGIDAARAPIEAKQRIGYVPQVAAFCEETVRGCLAFLAMLRGAPIESVKPLLVRVGLATHGRQTVRTLSTGMRQRLSLAAALIGDPPLLLMDEPTASLDLAGQAEFITLVRGLKASGKTILLTSHRAEEVRALADRVIVLDAGHVVADGSIDEVSAGVWSAGRPLKLAVGGRP